MNERVPRLPYGCNSWVATRKSDGKVIGEFYKRENVERFNPAKVLVQTAQDYLAGINKRA